MSGLVLELQQDALNKDVNVSDLLRKALVVSKKLGVTQIEEWLNKELNGYGMKDDIPQYREIRGAIKVWNPYHGWQPLNFGDPKMAETLSKRKIMQPVGELDSLGAGKGKGALQVPFPQETVNTLMRAMEIPLQPSLHVAPSEVVGILEAVRNNILDWALELEQKGILGEGMSFTKQEKQTASQITYQVTNNIGSMQNSQLQQGSPGASQSLAVQNDLVGLSALIGQIKKSIGELKLSEPNAKELLAEISTIESQASSSRPKTTIISESLKTIRTILENAAGNVLASGFLDSLARYF